MSPVRLFTLHFFWLSRIKAVRPKTASRSLTLDPHERIIEDEVG
jgi:hypothetical protein